ncbi:PLP-dependent aminotransferase family protein [Vacuolonema iberomarrocanum]|uniref:aminotransferase-like domain-containing protein n=1 Tax=Vacuolonema iberomarrocanum TaxID=3454632 RepID=UPI001A04EFF0|nr:PLP-dependent aminotransferase family protein [filamentous cyanobacterium LEGE 07170]
MNITPLEVTHEKNLYEQVAERIHSLIQEGTLQPGDRLPSVRKLKAQLSVSVSTVMEAYRLLEDRGLISVRPQSGYYVKLAIAQPPEPTESTPPCDASLVDTLMTFQFSRSSFHTDGLVQLGAAIPAVELMPTAALNRLMGQVLRQNPEYAHSYQLPPGCAPLRHEIARLMMNSGCSISPDAITITNGTMEAFYLALKAVTQPGDTVVIESPTYFGFLETLEELHLKALELPTHPREGLSLEALESVLQSRSIAACALVSNFSNPLGSCMSDLKKKQLAELLAQYEVPLVEDDIYGDLNFEGDRPKAVKAFDRHGLVLYCSSFSKTLSAGLRVGWCVAGRYQTRLERVKWLVNHTTPPANQLAIAAFLANGGYDRHLRQLRRTYQGQMTRMIQAICDDFPPETRVTQPTGGHILWLEIPGCDAMQLYKEALRYGIGIAPGPIFSPSRTYGHCFRLNSGILWNRDVEKAIQTLGHLVKQQLAAKILDEAPPLLRQH